MGFGPEHAQFAAERQAKEWGSSGGEWMSESLHMSPLDTQVLWLQSEPLKAFFRLS